MHHMAENSLLSKNTKSLYQSIGQQPNRKMGKDMTNGPRKENTSGF